MHSQEAENENLKVQSLAQKGGSAYAQTESLALSGASTYAQAESLTLQGANTFECQKFDSTYWNL